jgi:hypothetical protein
MEFSLKRKENLTHSHQGRAIELLGYGASGWNMCSGIPLMLWVLKEAGVFLYPILQFYDARVWKYSGGESRM